MGWFWWFLLASNLLIPPTMAGFGLAWWRGRVPTYRGGMGYKTRRSTRSPAAWVYAHRYFGRLWAVLGLALIPATVAVMALCSGREEEAVGLWGGAVCGVQTLLMLLPIPITEAALKRRF